MPMVRIFSGCCAVAARGHATAAPPSTPRNSRRFMSASGPGGILSLQRRSDRAKACGGLSSERTVAQPRHVHRPRPGRGPAEAAIFFRNLDVVDAGLAPAHQAVLVELPLLVAVGAVPLAGGIMPFVLEAHRDPVVVA